jgi:hypothetical protein
MSKIVEIRTYTLRPGTRDRFHELVVARTPLFKRDKIDLVAHGPSLHDDRSYFVIRAFGSLAEHTSDDTFDDIESSSTVVVTVEDDTFDAFASLVTGRPYRPRKGCRLVG